MTVAENKKNIPIIARLKAFPAGSASTKNEMPADKLRTSTSQILSKNTEEVAEGILIIYFLLRKKTFANSPSRPGVITLMNPAEK